MSIYSQKGRGEEIPFHYAIHTAFEGLAFEGEAAYVVYPVFSRIPKRQTLVKLVQRHGWRNSGLAN